MNSTVDKTYEFSGVTFERHGDRIVIPVQSQPINLSLKQWNEVFNGLNFQTYLKDTSQTSGS